MYTKINNKKYEIVLMDTFFKRLFGLMLKKEKITKAYLFPKCSSIHTYFMNQNIDVCILDKDFIIVYIQENMPRRRILIKKGYYTLEMPLNSLKNSKIGDKIKIENEISK